MANLKEFDFRHQTGGPRSESDLPFMAQRLCLREVLISLPEGKRLISGATGGQSAKKLHLRGDGQAVSYKNFQAEQPRSAPG